MPPPVSEADKRRLKMASDHEPSDTSSPGDDYFRHFLNRTIMLLGDEAVQALRVKTVAIAGCGGQGGAACLTLARMGVGNFILADPKPFDEPDINRQWGANLATLGRNKADVYAEMLLAINPEIGITKFCDGITDANVGDFLNGADLLVDCLDIAVPGSLRTQVFATASSQGMHIFTGAMLGFGGMVAGSRPGGIPLEILGGIEDAAITGSKIPPGIREVFVPEFMDRIEEYLHIHRAPSIAVSPALLGTLLSVEAVVALLGNTIPGWRPPICLPHLLLVDLLKINFRVVHLDDLLFERPPTNSGTPAVTSGEPGVPNVAVISNDDRRSLLASVGYNTNLLPHDSLDLDLLTDSWNEIPAPAAPQSKLDASWSTASAEQAIEGLYGYEYVVPVFRGRFAEALLCRALGSTGSSVVTNGLFPTTRFHLESNGFAVRELLAEEAHDLGSERPFKGDLDLQRLKETLAHGNEAGAIYLELCVNALGGHPVSMANLSAVYELATARGIPVILDTARAFENAALIREREPGFSGRTLVGIVRQMCRLTHACASSCAKDFRCKEGGFVATHNHALFVQLCDLSLAFGDGLSDATRRNIVQALSVSPDSAGGSAARTAQVRRLWAMLRERSVPVVAPAGGHAVFVDARALLPHIQPEQFPAQALANELFLVGGVRAAPNFATPDQQGRNVHLLRLAIPIGYCEDDALASVARAFESVMAHKETIRGLERIGAPPGVAGEFAAAYRAVKSS